MNFISAFDLRFEQALYAIRDDSMAQFFMWVTELGSASTVLGLTLAVAIVLAYRKRWPLIAGLFASVGGSVVSAYILKEIVARPRPDVSLQAYTASSLYSFPSLHAAFAVAFYCFVLWLIYDTLPPVRRDVMVGAAAILVLAIGFSRLYLGVHYPSDVLAGYALGGLLVFLGIKVAKYLEQKTTSV